MGRGRRARIGTRGGERIPPIAPRRTGLALALASGALELGLGALVAGDAGTATALAWYATLGALAVLAIGLVTSWPGPVTCSLALVGVLLLLRHHDRLVLAPVYGACLLLVGELAQRSAEIRGLERIGPDVLWSRFVAMLAAAAAGGSAAAIVAIAVTAGPPRSVAVTAAGTSCLIAGVAVIAVLARQRSGDVGASRASSISQGPGQSGSNSSRAPNGSPSV